MLDIFHDEVPVANVRQVGTYVAETLHDVLAAGENGRVRKRIAVEIGNAAWKSAEVDSRVSVGDDVGSADVVGPNEVAGREINAPGENGDRIPGAEGVDRCDLPSADDLIEESIHIDRFAFSDREFVDPAQLRHVRLMVVRDRTFEVAVEDVGYVFRVDCVIGETDRLGPGVRAKKREAALEVACDLDLKGVIRRRSDVREDVVDTCELRIRAQRLQVGPAESRVRLRDRARGAPRARQDVAVLLRHAEGQVIGLREPFAIRRVPLLPT